MKRESTFYVNTIKQEEKKIKSPVCLETHTASLDEYWKEFYSRHFDIMLERENLMEDYVVKDFFSATEEDYRSTKSIILIDPPLPFLNFWDTNWSGKPS